MQIISLATWLLFLSCKEEGSRLTRMHEAILAEDFKLIRALARTRSMLEGGGEIGCPPLLFAARRPKALPLLIQLGANINIRDKNGNTLAHYLYGTIGTAGKQSQIATFGNSLRTSPEDPLKVLLELTPLGLKLDVKNRNGQTPLMRAAEAQSFYSVVHMVANGAQVNIADSHGVTPLMYAIEGIGIGSDGPLLDDSVSMKLIRYLLDHGSNVLRADSSGSTALSRAMDFKHMEVADLLKGYLKR